MSHTHSPRTTYLKDYTPPPYSISAVDLTLELEETATKVTARLEIVRNAGAQPLILDGRKLELLALKLNESVLSASDYKLDAEHLVIPQVPAAFTLEIV